MSFVAATVVAVTPMSDVVFVDDVKNVLAVVDPTSWVGITSAGFKSEKNTVTFRKLEQLAQGPVVQRPISTKRGVTF